MSDQVTRIQHPQQPKKPNKDKAATKPDTTVSLHAPTRAQSAQQLAPVLPLPPPPEPPPPIYPPFIPQLSATHFQVMDLTPVPHAPTEPETLLRRITLSSTAIPRTVTGPAPTGNLRIAELNVNTLSEDKLRDIIILMATFAIDVALLIDTRAPYDRSKALQKIALSLLGQSSCVFISPASSTAKTPVGGQMILINKKWGTPNPILWTDKSNLGLVTSITLIAGSVRLSIFATYWPRPEPKPTPEPPVIQPAPTTTPNRQADQEAAKQLSESSSSDSDAPKRRRASTSNHPSSLWSQTESWLHKSKRRDSNPLTYVQDTAKHRILHHLQSTESAVILAGDLNSGWYPTDASTHRVADWANLSRLLTHRAPTTAATHEATCTFQRDLTGVSVIDHALYTPSRGILPTLTHTLTDPVWALITDHRPVLFDVLINNMSEDQHRNRILHPEYKRPPLADLCLAGWNRTPDSQGNIPTPPKKIQRYRKLLHKSLAEELAHPPAP